MKQLNYNMIGRLTATLDLQAARRLQMLYTPMLTDYKLVKEIYEAIKTTFPGLDKTDTQILFIASVYKMYSPASLVGKGCGNAPAGMRRALSEVLGYKNGTNINYFQNMARAYVKGERYVAKIESIINHFKTQ